MKGLIPLPGVASDVLRRAGVRQPRRKGLTSRPGTSPDKKQATRAANKRARASRKRNR